MKNLKKVLALVLVFASLLGLATMASATTSDDYSDAANITHIEAVDVMSTIGVFDGISGAFSGDSILTREQAAKIITYMVLGKDQADALVASVAPYTDVARDRWSAGSIAYCKNAGILAGVGNGRFEPNGKLTGVAFAKMCLVALGYDADVEKLTGSEWAVNTSKLAIADAGITDSLSQISLANEMSREDACQMAFNTLQANMVDYDDRGGSLTINGATLSMTASKAKPVSVVTGWQDTATQKNDGNIDGKDDGTTKGDGIQQFGEKYFGNLKKVGGTDSFGRPATTWTYKADEIGTYVDTSLLVKSWTTKASKTEMYNALGSSVYNGLVKNPAKLVSTVDSCYATAGDTAVKSDIDNYFNKNSSSAAGVEDCIPNAQTGNGVLTELYVDDNGNVWVAMINTYLVKANADYNTVKESVSVDPIAYTENDDDTAFLPTEISNDDFDVSGVKEGDYLLITVSGINEKFTESTLESVTPATIQKGTVTEYTEQTNVVMDGTKYAYNKILSDEKKDTDFAINSEATLVLDTYGYIMYVDDSVDSGSFVYISKFGSTSTLNSKALADAYFTDGTNEEISVSKVDKEKDQDNISSYQDKQAYFGWYTYTGSTGGKYTLTSLDSDVYTQKKSNGLKSTGQELIKSGTVKFMGKSGVTISGLDEVKGDDKTIFVIKTDDDVNAYTGIANVPGVTLSSKNKDVKVACVEKNGYAKYVFVDVSKDADVTIDDATSAADYMYILKTTKKTTYVDGLEYRSYTVVIDGNTEDRWVSTDLDVEDNRLYHSVKVDSNGRIKGCKEVGKEGDNSRRFMAAMGETAKEAATYYARNPYTSGKDTVIKRSGTTLTVGALANASYKDGSDTVDKSDLITNEKSNINLVIGKGCDLLKDDDADYETYLNTSINQVTGLLGKKGLAGRVYLVTTEKDGDVVESLWIYVEDVYDV